MQGAHEGEPVARAGHGGVLGEQGLGGAARGGVGHGEAVGVAGAGDPRGGVVEAKHAEVDATAAAELDAHAGVGLGQGAALGVEEEEAAGRGGQREAEVAGAEGEGAGGGEPEGREEEGDGALHRGTARASRSIASVMSTSPRVWSCPSRWAVRAKRQRRAKGVLGKSSTSACRGVCVAAGRAQARRRASIAARVARWASVGLGPAVRSCSCRASRASESACSGRAPSRAAQGPVVNLHPITPRGGPRSDVGLGAEADGVLREIEQLPAVGGLAVIPLAGLAVGLAHPQVDDLVTRSPGEQHHQLDGLSLYEEGEAVAGRRGAALYGHPDAVVARQHHHLLNDLPAGDGHLVGHPVGGEQGRGDRRVVDPGAQGDEVLAADHARRGLGDVYCEGLGCGCGRGRGWGLAAGLRGGDAEGAEGAEEGRAGQATGGGCAWVHHPRGEARDRLEGGLVPVRGEKCGWG